MLRLFSRIAVCCTVAVAAVVIAVPHAGAKTSAWDEAAARRKADYLFMKASSKHIAENHSATALLMERAHALDPSDAALAMEAEQYVNSYAGIDKDQAMTRMYRAMERYVRENPDDRQYIRIFAQLAQHLGTYDAAVEAIQRLSDLNPDKTDIKENLVEILLSRFDVQGDTTDALRALSIIDGLLAANPKELGLTSQKVLAYSMMGNRQAIEAISDTLIAEKPRDIRAMLFAGDVFRSIDKPERAAEAYKLANRADTTDGRPLIRLANIYLEQGDSLGYEDEVYRALAGENIDYDEKHGIMVQYVRNQYADSTKWPRIQQLFRVLERVNPDEGRMFQLEAAFEEIREDFAAAREKLIFAAALDPLNVQVQQRLVQLDMVDERYDDAIAHSRTAMPLFPDNFLFPITASLAYIHLEKADSAVALLESVPLNEVRNPKAAANLLGMLGDAYEKAGNMDSAIVAYERAVALDNNNFGIYNNLAYFLATQGRDLDRALRYANFATLAEPDNPTYLDTYAYALYRGGNYIEAKDFIDKALCLLNLTVTYQSGGHPYTFPYCRQEERDFTIEDTDTVPVDTVDVDQPEISAETRFDLLSHAGDIYFRCGATDAAVAFWREALLAKPEDEETIQKIKNKRLPE